MDVAPHLWLAKCLSRFGQHRQEDPGQRGSLVTSQAGVEGGDFGEEDRLGLSSQVGTPPPHLPAPSQVNEARLT